jgi:hypothetical protein
VNLEFVDAPFKVHSDKGIAIQYMLPESSFHEDFISRSIVILRNPFDRFTSFWFNKIILMQDLFYFRLSKQYFPNIEISNFELIRDGAKKFLVSADFKHLLENDIHMRHQHLSVSLDKKYDLYVETKDLSNLPMLLSQKFPEYKSLEVLKFPIDNSTDKVQLRNFLDTELRALVMDRYRKDFELIGSLGLLTYRDDFQSPNEPDENVLDSINKVRLDGIFQGLFRVLDLQESKNSLTEMAIEERDVETAQRDELTSELSTAVVERDLIIQALTSERDRIAAKRDAETAKLEAVVNSRIWKLSKFYREARSLKTNGL